MTSAKVLPGGLRLHSLFSERSPYRYDADTLHAIARKLEAERTAKRRALGADLRRVADALYRVVKEDEGRS